MAAIHVHERGLSAGTLERLARVPGLRLYGIADPARLDERVPTFAFTLDGHAPRAIAEHLPPGRSAPGTATSTPGSWCAQLGLADAGGLLRIGLVHYNTLEEVDRLVEALVELQRA